MRAEQELECTPIGVSRCEGAEVTCGLRLLHRKPPVVGADAVARETRPCAEERIIAMIPRAVGEQIEPAAELLVQLEDEGLSASGLPTGGRIAVCGAEGPKIGEIVVVRTAREVPVRRAIAVEGRRMRRARGDASPACSASFTEMERDEVRIEGVMVGALVGRRPVRDDLRDQVQ